MSRLIARTFPRADVIGVDLREQYLGFARSRARAEDIRNLVFHSADVFALPFTDAAFDVVWTKYLLQWLKEPTRALKELQRVTRPGGIVVSCDFAGFAIEHFPVTAEFDRQVRHVMTALVDCDVGRKVAPMMISLGFRNVKVEIEADKIFTVIGRIDAERRWNWEKQLQAARPHLIQIIGTKAGADRFVEAVLRNYDDPTTCSTTTLHFTQGKRDVTDPLGLFAFTIKITGRTLRCVSCLMASPFWCATSQTGLEQKRGHPGGEHKLAILVNAASEEHPSVAVF